MCALFVFLSFCIITLRFVHGVVCINSSYLFFCWIIFQCMDIPQFVYPFIHWWTFGLFSSFGLLRINLLWTYKSLYGHIFSFHLGVEWLNHVVRVYLTLSETAKLVFWSGFIVLHSYQQSSSCSKASPIPGIVSLSNFSHFSVCVMVSL